MAQTAPQFDWESARPVEEEPQATAAPAAADDTYPGAPLNDPAAQSPGTVSPVMFDWESARPVEARPEFDVESAQPLRELAKDPSYLMSREQYRAYREETKEDNNQVGEFLAGIPGVIPGLYAMGAGTIGEVGQQISQNWYRPDKLTAALAANANEGVRRSSLFLGKLVDYVGQNLRDSDIRRKREAAYGEQIRLRMQQEGKLSGDPVRDHETVMQALFAAKEAGEIPLTDEQIEEDEERAYQDYWRGKAFDQSMANITDINVAGAEATAPDSRFVGRNMVTGEVVLPGEFSPDLLSMVVAPDAILAAGIGSVMRVDALRRAGILLGKGLKPTGEALSATGGAITRGADAITERIQLATGGQRVGDKVVGGLSREAQTYGGAAAATAVGYVTGGDTIVDQGLTGALALLPTMRLAGATLRRAGATAGAGWVITNEMAAGPMSAARAETAERLAAGGAIPERYSKFFRNEGRASADSTLRRVAQDQANPALLRSLAQFGDNVGLTKAVRVTDDALGGAIGGAAVTAPFALGASDPEMAGNIVGAGIVLGAAGGVAGGKLTRMSQMQDAMVARMLVDSEASGGNAAAFARAYSHGELTYMAGLQAFSRGKLKFVPLTTSEYRVNLDTKRRGGENTAGFHVEVAADGSQKVFINIGEPSAVAGEVVKIRPVTKGGKTIEVRGADGKSTFTYVPNEAKILVKQGDTVAAGDALTRNTSATLSVPEEIGHAIFSSNVMDGLPRDEMRNYINQRYKTDGVARRGREYVSRLVDQEIAAGVHGAADTINDATRDRLIEDRFTEMSRASLEAGDDALDWSRDEIIGATMRAATRGVDLNRLRNQSNFSRLAEQMLASSAQVLRVFGVDVDKMGRVVDPAGIFRDNPVFADPAIRRMVSKYMRDYDQWLAGMEQAGRKDRRGVRVAPSGRAEDLANSPHTVLREVKDANGNGTGVFENDVITRGPDGVVRPKKQADIDRTEVLRAAQIKSLWDASKTVPTASTEFGKRRVNGRDVVGGPTLPPQWDLFTQFPQWIREFARQLEAGRAEGRTHIADYNAIGTGASGRYRVTNLGNIEAILREVAFVGWQVTKKNHLLATVFDMNAFRAAAKRAIDNGELGEFGNNMDEVNATLLQYLDNHKNGRPGEYGIGQTKKSILNGLIGTGTAKQTAANPFYSDLNPRGSVRTFRVDRLNDLRDTGRTGYNFMYEPINANMMPDAQPAPRGQAMADVSGQQTMIQRNPAGEYEPLGMLRKQKNGKWAVYTAPMMATNKDGSQTMLPPTKLAEYPNEAKARARAEKEFFTSLPLQDAKQYMGARERQAITEAQRRIAEVAKNNPEAARLEVTRDERGLPKVGLIEDADGNPVLDERGNQKFGAIYRKAPYDLRKAPGLSKDEAKAVQQAADLLEADALRGRAVPAIAKGIGWYGRMRGWLQRAYGATIELFGQLLGATSARTPVDTNFIQAREALQIFGRGGYDDLLKRFDAFVAQKKADADSGKMEAEWRKKGGKGTFKLEDEYRKQINKFGEMPLRANGKKYNANSTKVLHALYGVWLTQTKGPKTPNFAGNLTGRTFKATIDVWAARNLRRLLYANKTKRWRILPEQEQGVNDVDFFFAQKVYDEVGRRMNLPSDDLQALQWFNEKDIWETNGWTDKTGAEKSSFDKEAGKLNLDRYQVGLTTFQDASNFDPAVQRAELAAFRDSVRAQEGLEAARVTESEGLYGDVIEPTFDAEFSVNRSGDVSPSIEPIVRQAIDTANRNKQKDVFISAVVDETHPNARPMVEVGFKSAASRAEIDAVTAVFRGAGIDGFTVARNERGDVLGIRAQYVPEISARYDTLDHLDPVKFGQNAATWAANARKAIANISGQDNVSYRKEGHVSTNVYGIEEYGSVTPADILRSNARTELGRRRAIIAAGTR